MPEEKLEDTNCFFSRCFEFKISKILFSERLWKIKLTLPSWGNSHNTTLLGSCFSDSVVNDNYHNVFFFFCHLREIKYKLTLDRKLIFKFNSIYLGQKTD